MYYEHIDAFALLISLKITFEKPLPLGIRFIALLYMLLSILSGLI
jgi:hypothetical protein